MTNREINHSFCHETSTTKEYEDVCILQICDGFEHGRDFTNAYLFGKVSGGAFLFDPFCTKRNVCFMILNCYWKV